MSSMWNNQLSAVKRQPKQPIRNFFKTTWAVSVASFHFLYFFTISVLVFLVVIIALELMFNLIKSIK